MMSLTHQTKSLSLMRYGSLQSFAFVHLKSCLFLFLSFFQNTKPVDFSFNPLHEQAFKFYDQTLVDSNREKDPTCHEFFRLLALCHTVMPDEKNGIRFFNGMHSTFLFMHIFLAFQGN